MKILISYLIGFLKGFLTTGKTPVRVVNTMEISERTRAWWHGVMDGYWLRIRSRTRPACRRCGQDLHTDHFTMHPIGGMDPRLGPLCSTCSDWRYAEIGKHALGSMPNTPTQANIIDRGMTKADVAAASTCKFCGIIVPSGRVCPACEERFFPTEPLE
jgi:hypothetical protein